MIDITDEHERAFQIDGVVRIPGVLSKRAIDRLLQLANELVKSSDGINVIEDPTVYVKRDGTGFCEFVSRHFTWIKEEVDFAKIAHLAKTLSRSSEVFFWRDEIFSKQPDDAGNATPWHHAIGSLPFKGEKTTVVWIPLVDLDNTTSPLRTIRGSSLRHRRRYRPPTGREDLPLIEGYSNIPDFDSLIEKGEESAMTWTAEAGDAVIFSAYTVHGSLPNTSQQTRHAYVTRWLGDDVVWQPDVYSVLDSTIDPFLMLHNSRPIEPYFERFS